MLYMTPKIFEGLDRSVFGYLARRRDIGAVRMVRDGYTWAADNGMFTNDFSEERTGKYPGWWEWLERMKPWQSTCVFVVVPDVVGDAKATLGRWKDYAPRMRAMGYPLAYAVQDGQEALPLPSDYDAMFIGGSTEWKLGPHAQALAARCKRDKKWLHVGRVNSNKRVMHCRRMGADSVDGTYVIFGPDKNLPKVKQWMSPAQLEIGIENTAYYV